MHTLLIFLDLVEFLLNNNHSEASVKKHFSACAKIKMSNVEKSLIIIGSAYVLVSELLIIQKRTIGERLCTTLADQSSKEKSKTPLLFINQWRKLHFHDEKYLLFLRLRLEFRVFLG